MCPILFQNGFYCVILFIRNVQTRQIFRDRKETGDCLGLEGMDGRKWGVTVNGYGISLRCYENGLKFDIGDGCAAL